MAVQIITALLGSLGFALMFNLGRRNVIPAAVNGMCTWIVYILVRNIIDDVFIPSLAASLWAAIYAEIAARIMKAPANQYLIVGLIPLLPGAPLYYRLEGRKRIWQFHNAVRAWDSGGNKCSLWM